MSLASPTGQTGKRRRTDSEDKTPSALSNSNIGTNTTATSTSPVEAGTALSAHIPKRGARACTACRKGKNRCEGEAPCRRCQLSGTQCVFEKPEKKNVVPLPTNTLDRISRLESQYLIMQSTMIGMQSSLDRIFSAVQMNTAATSASSSQSFSPIDEPKKFPPLPGFAPPPHKYATYGILPSTAPSSDDESEDTLPRATMNAPIEALQGLANAAAEAAAAAAAATAPIPVPPRVKKRRKAEPIPRNAFPSVLEKGLVSESEAQELYHIFFSGCHLFIPLFDPAFDTYEGLKERTPFCFDAILAVASKIRSGNGPPTPTFFKCLEEAQGIARSTLFGPIVRKEAVQAMLLLSAWSTNGWLPCGHAMRMALDLGLHRALDKLADSGSIGNNNERGGGGGGGEDFMNTSPGRDDLVEIDMPETHTSGMNNVNGSHARARSMSGSVSASASGSATPPPTAITSQQTTATTQSGPTPASGSSSDTHHVTNSSSTKLFSNSSSGSLTTNIKKRSEEEERDLVVSARIWLCLYWFDHQLSLGTGRPIVLRNDNSIKHCRLLLSHPMSGPTDVRLVAQIELILQKTQIYEALSSVVSDRQGTNNASTIVNIIRRAQIGLDKWWAEWDGLHASQGHPPNSLLRKILSSELYYAKLWLVCVGLRGASWDKLPFEQREMAFQAKEAASRCLEVFLGCAEYRAALRYAVHDSLVTAAFSGLFLLKMAHLFPAEVDIAAIATQVEQLAGLLSDVAAERYAVTLRLMLLNLRRKMGIGFVSYAGGSQGQANVHSQQMNMAVRSQGQVHSEGIVTSSQQQLGMGVGNLPLPPTVLVPSHSHPHTHPHPHHPHPHSHLHPHPHQHQHQHQHAHSHPHQHQHTHNIDTLVVPPQVYIGQSINMGSPIPNGVSGMITSYSGQSHHNNPNSNSNTNGTTSILASINTGDFGFVWPDADGGMFSPSMVPLWLQEQSLSDLGIPINGTDGIFLNVNGPSGWNGDFVSMPEAW